MAYTVAESVRQSGTGPAWAPSFQFIVANETNNVTYARLVWEPYQQDGELDQEKGTFAGLESGLWWGGNVFRSGDLPTVSMDRTRQPLSHFFSEGIEAPVASGAPTFSELFGPDTRVLAVSIRQGSGTDVKSLVTSVTINGQMTSFVAPAANSGPAPTTVYGDWTVTPAPATERYTTQSRQAQEFAYAFSVDAWDWVRASTAQREWTETVTIDNPAWQAPAGPSTPEPTPAPPAPETLTPATQSQDLVTNGANTIPAGQTTPLFVGLDRVGEEVDVWVFSTPRFLGRFLVNADGTVSVPIPADMSGSHRVVVTSPAPNGEVGDVLAWSYVTVAAPQAGAPEAGAPANDANRVPRAATGYAEGGTAPALWVVLGLGVTAAGALVIRRRAVSN
ncbi:hypothetical protein [Xylanimonas ulmi]|uniref:hypothetical protein n=1 Tax=Xylanimonas ulmi TaxID=228973 RepID=UPI001A920853|nr:hypothetical protein [Xylanibacterium ulmi]